ncbi:Uma2 family endonuclease [Streptomyces sp. NPDC008001]|uniref:Uma2 family endonuclease n=1 Tax=Streptomyces sp. NPDC008001 TaxID=3364804 RepID=UPI0036E19064
MAVMVETPPPPQLIVRGPGLPGDFEELCTILEKINDDLPDGYYPEIIGGQVVVSPWSRSFYDLILDELMDQLGPRAPKGHRARSCSSLYKFTEHDGAFGPDFHVAESAALRTTSIYRPGDALSLVAELTSPSTAEADRNEKAEVYGKAGVPVYVLVDVLKGVVAVHSDPSDHGYRAMTQIEFGGTVHIPAPFDCELDTSGWEV